MKYFKFVPDDAQVRILSDNLIEGIEGLIQLYFEPQFITYNQGLTVMDDLNFNRVHDDYWAILTYQGQVIHPLLNEGDEAIDLIYTFEYLDWNEVASRFIAEPYYVWPDGSWAEQSDVGRCPACAGLSDDFILFQPNLRREG